MYRKPPTYLIPYKRNPMSKEMIEAAVKYLEKGETLHNRLEEVFFFEREFANYCGRKYAVGLNSGTTALYNALVVCGVGKGDEVIVPPNSFAAVGHSVWTCGAIPVFVDVEEDTFNIDASKIEEKITDKTKAIMPVAHFGHPCDMDPIMDIAEEHDLYVVENDAMALGAKYKGKRVPIGHMGVFCLSVKGLWLPGGGGFVATDDEEIAEKIEARRYLGFSRSISIAGLSTSLGLNYKMTDIGATIGRVQLKNVDEYIERQRKNASIYTKLLEDTPVKTPIEKDYAYHVFLRYGIVAPRRDELKNYLHEQGVECHNIYQIANYLQPMYVERFGYKKGDFPVTDKQKDLELSLPEPRSRTQWELEYVTNKIKEFYA